MTQEIKDLIKNNPTATGLIIGALFLVALISMITFFILRKRKRGSYNITEIKDEIRSDDYLMRMSDEQIKDLSFDVESSKRVVADNSTKHPKKSKQMEFEGVDNLGNTVFHHYAVNSGDEDLIKQLLFDLVQSKKYDILNRKNDNGDAPLHIATTHGNDKFVKDLIFSGANIDIQNKNNETPLHIATKNENLDLVNFFLLKNANLNVQNKEGKTPLHIAIERNDFKIAKALNDACANLLMKDKEGNAPLHLLINRNVENLESNSNKDYKAFIKTLKNDENKNAFDEKNISGDAPLHIAARNNHYRIANRLIKNECDINIKNNLGDTPLHVAIKNERMTLSRLLISKKANQNIKNNDGFSAKDLMDIQLGVQNKNCNTKEKNIHKSRDKNEEEVLSFNKIGMPIKPSESLKLKDKKEKTDECC